MAYPRVPSLLLVSLLVTAACGTTTPSPASPPAPAPEREDPAMTDLAAKSARFAPTDLSADVSALPESERKALAHLIRAAQVMDALFLRQVWAGNESMLASLAADDTRAGKARLTYFLVNKGPWSRLDEGHAFVPGVGPKPHSANFYPEDATREQVERWMNALPFLVRYSNRTSASPAPYSTSFWIFAGSFFHGVLSEKSNAFAIPVSVPAVHVPSASPMLAIAPSARLSEGSGTTRAGSTRRSVPRPSQPLHAP